MFVDIVFWMSVGLVAYAYVGYPLALIVLSLFRTRPVTRADVSPSVTFIITAYNEDQRIVDKLENTLRLDYPRGKLEIIVASDCSGDQTDALVQSYEKAGVKLVRTPERKGKEAAQHRAVQLSSGEILIFSDVATILSPDGIRKIVSNFRDPTVGCVSSVDRFIDSEGNVSGEGAYVKYEMWLRGLETKVNTLVGLSGSFFAARRQVCLEWATDLQSDFNTLLNAVKLGLRGVADLESIGYYKNLSDEKREFERKVRTVLRGISVFMKSKSMLNPFRYGIFSWQLLSHKLCRWLVPFAMIMIFFTSLYGMVMSNFYLVAFVIQVAFYSAVAVSFWSKHFARTSVLRLPVFFVLVNLSILNAWYRYARGEQIVAWSPSKR